MQNLFISESVKGKHFARIDCVWYSYFKQNCPLFGSFQFWYLNSVFKIFQKYVHPFWLLNPKYVYFICSHAIALSFPDNFIFFEKLDPLCSSFILNLIFGNARKTCFYSFKYYTEIGFVIKSLSWSKICVYKNEYAKKYSFFFRFIKQFFFQENFWNFYICSLYLRVRIQFKVQ